MVKRRKRRREKVSARRAVEQSRVGGGSLYLKIPSGLGVFQVKSGRFRFDFMSYTVGKGNPSADEGQDFYERTFWIHKGIGPDNEWHLCASKTLKKKCPVCEYRARLASSPDSDPDLELALAPKKRQLWLVKDLANADQGFQLWEYSFHSFGRDLYQKIDAAEDEDNYEFFADPEEGMTVRAAFAQSDRGKWQDLVDIEFRPRKVQYEEDLISEMPCLDEMLVETPYDRLKSLLLEADEEDDEDELQEPPKKIRKKKEKKSQTSDEFEEGDTVKHEEFGMCLVVRVSKDGTSLTLEDEDGEKHKAVSSDDVEQTLSKPEKKEKKEETEEDDDDDWEDEEEEEEEEEEPKPKKKTGKKPSKKSGKKKKKEEPEEDEEDDDDDWD